jgi:hypothetical protein
MIGVTYHGLTQIRRDDITGHYRPTPLQIIEADRTAPHHNPQSIDPIVTIPIAAGHSKTVPRTPRLPTWRPF